MNDLIVDCSRFKIFGNLTNDEFWKSCTFTIRDSLKIEVYQTQYFKCSITHYVECLSFVNFKFETIFFKKT